MMKGYGTNRAYDFSQATADSGVGGLEGRTSGKQQGRLGDFAQELVGQGITSKDDVLKAGKAKGFTLIELLVVVSIISLLMGIMLPALGAARDTARKTQCLSNVHNMGIATFAYAGDNKDAIPRNLDTANSFIKLAGLGVLDIGKFAKDEYLSDLRVYFCPAASNNAPHFTYNLASKLKSADEDLEVNYLWRNGSNTPNVGGIPSLPSKLSVYSNNNYKLLIDSNFSYAAGGYVNHFQSGFVQHASILSPDGHAVGVSDPNNDSVSGGDTDLIFKWADKQK